MLLLLIACAEPKVAPAASDTTTPPCEAADDDTEIAVVTDIDGTLTLSDDEFLTQLDDASYDPNLRPDADLLLQGYASLGYRIIYVTGRGERMELSDGTLAREATLDWIEAHALPLADDDDLFLAANQGAIDPVGYKSGVILDLRDDGFDFAWAYGNGDTDVEAFLAGGLDPHDVFYVGEDSNNASTYGAVAVPDDEAYTTHLDTWLATVPCASGG